MPPAHVSVKTTPKFMKEKKIKFERNASIEKKTLLEKAKKPQVKIINFTQLDSE